MNFGREVYLHIDGHLEMEGCCDMIGELMFLDGASAKLGLLVRVIFGYLFEWENMDKSQ